MNPLREAAIEYALRGWAVFPLNANSKQPNSTLVPQGYKEASKQASDCLYWWGREPDGNIGIACRPSGIVVIDVDERAGGHDTLWEWEQQYGGIPEMTPCQLTPTGGLHYIFKHPGVDLKGQLGPGVDIKDLGYILAAPSSHPYGGNYVWSDEAAMTPYPLPPGYVEALTSSQRKDSGGTRHLEPSTEPLLQIPAAQYVEVLTGRDILSGWMQCPFHKDGQERTPSFKVNGTMWACFGCEPIMGKQVMGGNIIDLAGMLKGYAMPLRGVDLQEVKAQLEGMFCSVLT